MHSISNNYSTLKAILNYVNGSFVNSEDVHKGIPRIAFKLNGTSIALTPDSQIEDFMIINGTRAIVKSVSGLFRAVNITNYTGSLDARTLAQWRSIAL